LAALARLGARDHSPLSELPPRYRDPLRQQLLTVDNHSPGTIRPLVVRNFVAWYKAFDVRDGKLYLPPEQRIRIW